MAGCQAVPVALVSFLSGLAGHTVVFCLLLAFVKHIAAALPNAPPHLGGNVPSSGFQLALWQGRNPLCFRTEPTFPLGAGLQARHGQHPG